MAYHCLAEFNHKGGITTHECVLRLNVLKNVQYESLKSVFMTLTWMIDRPYKQQSLLDLVSQPLVIPIKEIYNDCIAFYLGSWEFWNLSQCLGL